MANEQERMRRFMAQERDRVNVFNLDPSRKRGYLRDSEEIYVPPLGVDGNPAEMSRVTANHIIGHVSKSIKGDRHWLTLDKSLYEKYLAEFKESGKVRNPKDRDVISTRRGVTILTPKLLEEYDENENREKVGLGKSKGKNADDKAPEPPETEPKKEKIIKV
jgi:hypothetical protein